MTAVTTTEHGTAFPWRRRGQLRNDSGDNSSSSPLLFSILHKRSIEVHQKLLAALDELENHGANNPRVAGSVIAVLLFFLYDYPSSSRHRHSRRHSRNGDSKSKSQQYLSILDFCIVILTMMLKDTFSSSQHLLNLILVEPS